MPIDPQAMFKTMIASSRDMLERLNQALVEFERAGRVKDTAAMKREIKATEKHIKSMERKLKAFGRPQSNATDKT